MIVLALICCYVLVGIDVATDYGFGAHAGYEKTPACVFVSIAVAFVCVVIAWVPFMAIRRLAYGHSYKQYADDRFFDFGVRQSS